jgi:hypothetical protein
MIYPIQTFAPKLEYSVSEIDYLFSEPTAPIWDRILYYIKKHNSKSIIDVGCAHGAANKFFTNYDYIYHGVDGCKELIDHANSNYAKDGITFEHCDWFDSTTSGPYDCMLMLGVLPYGLSEYGHTRNRSATDMYQSLVDKYNPTQIIIRETCKIQNGVEIELETVDLTPFLEIATDVEYINVDTILGNKVLINVTRTRT